MSKSDKMNFKIINCFEKIGLITLQNKAPLLDRVDVKFAFSRLILDAVLQDCLDEYQILEIDGNFIFDYTTTYYDTANLLFYKQHRNGKGNRLKIRTRVYENSQVQFIEVKKKTNKGKTVKSRIASSNIALENKFLKEKTGFQMADLNENIISRYRRITLLHKQNREKITLDLNLNFENKDKKIAFDNIVIAEVKSEKNGSALFVKIMKFHKIKEGSLSKYCLGVLTLGNTEKYNNFKSLYVKLLNLNNKLKND
jgi:hypothetical protein